MMKKLFLFAAAAAFALTSCSKDGATGGEENASKTNLVVSIANAPLTYAVDTPREATGINANFNTVYTYLVQSNGAATRYDWTSVEIAAKSKSFEQVLLPDNVIVLTNVDAALLPPVNTTAENITNALKTITIASQNGGVENVTLYGQSIPSPDGTASDGHDQYKANVALKSLVARFEAGPLTAGTGLVSLTVDEVYVNYYYQANDAASSKVEQTESTWDETVDLPWRQTSGALATGACYSYQVFPFMIPHIIYKVSGTLESGAMLPDGTEGVFTEKYVTIRGYNVRNNDDNSVAPLASIEAHNIYKVGLAGIPITPDQITDKPEKSRVDLTVTITVADWTVNTLEPEI